MEREDRPVITLDDGERNRLHAVWSRSGKRLIVSVVPRGKWDESAQVELDPEQVQELRAFLSDTLPHYY
jgi:hypothetical protein